MEEINISVLKNDEIKEYSALMVEVMEEFNQEDIDDFQYWFTSVEGISLRREYGFGEDKLDTVQFTAKHNGKIIGALEIESKRLIQSFFVKKDFQNKGIGRMLLNYSLTFFRKRGITIPVYIVHSSKYAINIYKSFGFKGDGERLTFYNTRQSGLFGRIFVLKKYINRITFIVKRRLEKYMVRPQASEIFSPAVGWGKLWLECNMGDK